MRALFWNSSKSNERTKMLMQVIRIARVNFGTVLKVPPNLVLGNATLAEATHSGHWNPTGALIMQSGHIVRSQRPHDT